MKKLIATTLGLGLLGSAAFAQGLVNVGNANTTDMYTSLGGSNVTTAGSASATYEYELLTAPSTGPTGALAGYGVVGGSLAGLLGGGWSDSSLLFSNSAIAGRVSAPSGSTVLNWAGAAAQNFIVIGWSANLGSWAQVSADLQGATLAANGSGLMWTGGGFSGLNAAQNYFVGATVVGDLVSGATGSGAGPNIFGTVSTGASPINTSTLLYSVQVPEPTTFALAGLGTAALLIFRRRK